MALPKNCDNRSLHTLACAYAKSYVKYCEKKEIENMLDPDTILEYVRYYARNYSEIDEDIMIITYPLYAADMLNNLSLTMQEKNLSADILAVAFFDHTLMALMLTYVMKDILTTYMEDGSQDIKEITLTDNYGDNLDQTMEYEHLVYYDLDKILNEIKRDGYHTLESILEKWKNPFVNDKDKSLLLLLSDKDYIITYYDDYAFTYKDKHNFIDYPIQFADFVIKTKLRKMLEN